MISPEKQGHHAQPSQAQSSFSGLNMLKMGTGRGYSAAAPTDTRAHDIQLNQLEMSLESSFFDGASFIEDGGEALVNNMST